MTKYAAYDEITIYAVGDTPEQAIHDAEIATRHYMRINFKLAKIDDEFAKKVEKTFWDGDQYPFIIVNGNIVDASEFREHHGCWAR